MKLASDHKQAVRLKCLYDFPDPDLVMQYFWASDTHPYHMKSDETLLHKYEDVDIVPEEKGMLKGVVTSVTFLGVHYEIIVDIGGFKWMIQTTDFVDVDEHIGIYLEPDAIHVMRKSKFSGLYGDYSSFSNEFDELEVPPEEDESERTE